VQNFVQQKNLKNKKFSFLILFLFVLIVYFYLRQQISIINLQNKIKQMYDEIRILENENKEISLKIQDFLQEENLQKLAEKLGFEPISEKDIVEYKDE
jgi:cell division protein FtsL